jgi:hypothetical protein
LVLVYAWVNREVAGTDEAVLWALIVVTFPVALSLSSLGFVVFLQLNRLADVVVPGGFGFNATFWVLSVAGAYWFWFVLVPRLAGHER